jgi:hypothetical protein
MNDIEDKIWEFIDGNLSATEHNEIKLLIDCDNEYKQKYHEIFTLVENLESISLDEPSMSFSYNVMEKVKLINLPLSDKARVDTRLIKFISGFFILSLVLILVYTFKNTNWSDNSNIENPLNLSFANLSISPNLKSTFIQLFSMIDVLIALLLIDKFIRHKKSVSI